MPGALGYGVANHYVRYSMRTVIAQAWGASRMSVK